MFTMKHLLLTTIAAVVLVGFVTMPPQDLAVFNAVQKGDIKAVKQYLDAGGDVNAKNSVGFTPLHYAAHEGHMEIAELLITNSADVNEKVSGGRTPLHRAASLGHKEIAELLIANGADVNAKEGNGRTPLNEAARWGHNEVADLLRKHGGKATRVVDTIADDRPPAERRRTETIGTVGRIGLGVAIERLKWKEWTEDFLKAKGK